MCVLFEAAKDSRQRFFLLLFCHYCFPCFLFFVSFFLKKFNNIHVTKCLSCLGLCRENGRCVNLGLSNPLHITSELYLDPAELHPWGSATLVAAVGLLNDLEV